VAAYKALPLRALSRWWGRVHARELPEWLRPALLGAYVGLFGCNMEEAALGADLRRYRNLGELFRRQLRPGCRPVDAVSAIVAPCDGRIDFAGPVADAGVGRIPAIKGVTYPLNRFLGAQPGLRPESTLYQVLTIVSGS